jgi:8-oxo-dGTP diphosphatase
MTERVVGVYAIVRCKDEFLLLHRVEDFDVWEFPGGDIEFGEHPREAARRELAEETGIEARDLDYYGVSSVVRPDGKMEIPIFFLVQLSKTPPVRLSEHEGYGWFDLGEMKELENLALSVKSILPKLERDFR